MRVRLEHIIVNTYIQDKKQLSGATGMLGYSFSKALAGEILPEEAK